MKKIRQKNVLKKVGAYENKLGLEG